MPDVCHGIRHEPTPCSIAVDDLGRHRLVNVPFLWCGILSARHRLLTPSTAVFRGHAGLPV